VDIRGNIDTRLKKLRETPEWSALVLAAAGLDRLQPAMAGLTVTRLPFSVMLPAPGQGALALQTRSDSNYDVIELLQGVHDAATFAAVRAEREFLRALGGGCEEPIAAHAQLLDRGLMHLAGAAWLNGEAEPRRGSLKGKVEKPERLGADLAAKLSR
jgi:hydroxymethylbilane synthase